MPCGAGLTARQFNTVSEACVDKAVLQSSLAISFAHLSNVTAPAEVWQASGEIPNA